MRKVTIISPRTTPYQKAHRTAEVLLTPRIQELIDAGVLTIVTLGTAYVTPVAAPAAPLTHLADEARKLDKEHQAANKVTVTDGVRGLTTDTSGPAD